MSARSSAKNQLPATTDEDPGAAAKALSQIIERGSRVQEPAIRAYVGRLRAHSPDATPAEIVKKLEKHYLAAVMASGAAVGSAAAFPGVGTLAAMSAVAGETVVFLEATSVFVLAVAEVHGIPADRWDGPGLGEWDLRALVGHASRSLITVSTYLQQPAEHEDINTPQQYYAMVNPAALGFAPAGIVERGRQAGRDLGAYPAATVDGLVSRVLGELSDVGDPLITVIGGAGIRLHTYLPTRTFELAVHGLDIARAVDISIALPADVLEEATALAARIAAAEGHGETVLLALTGRDGLPPSFSIV